MDDLDLKSLLETQKQILEELNSLKYGDRQATIGEKIADWVVGFLGSWRFIICQSFVFIFWLIANVIWLSGAGAFDPYPFVLLNLLLTFQSAFAGPLILLASNRSEMKERKRANTAYQSVERVENLLTALNSKVKKVKTRVRNNKKDKRQD